MSRAVVWTWILLALALTWFGIFWFGFKAWGIIDEPDCKVVWRASSTDQTGRTHTTSNCDPE